MSIFTASSQSSLRRFYAAAGLPCLMVSGLVLTGQVASAQIAKADLSTEQLSRDSRGENATARSRYAQAKLAENARRDSEARDIYVDLLRVHPNMIEALHDLAYLQATSADAAVRNPQQAIQNAYQVIDMAEKRMVQRRRIRGEKNVRNPYNAIPLPASFYQVRMLNTMAVAYAAAGRFQPLQSKPFSPMAGDQLAMDAGCGDEANAAQLASMALEGAQQTLRANPSPENHELMSFVQHTHETIMSGKAVFGIQQPPMSGVSLQ